jgi:hypothetical protein
LISSARYPFIAICEIARIRGGDGLRRPRVHPLPQLQGGDRTYLRHRCAIGECDQPLDDHVLDGAGNFSFVRRCRLLRPRRPEEAIDDIGQAREGRVDCPLRDEPRASGRLEQVADHKVCSEGRRRDRVERRTGVPRKQLAMQRIARGPRWQAAQNRGRQRQLGRLERG